MNNVKENREVLSKGQEFLAKQIDKDKNDHKIEGYYNGKYYFGTGVSLNRVNVEAELDNDAMIENADGIFDKFVVNKTVAVCVNTKEFLNMLKAFNAGKVNYAYVEVKGNHLVMENDLPKGLMSLKSNLEIIDGMYDNEPDKGFQYKQLYDVKKLLRIVNALNKDKHYDLTLNINNTKSYGPDSSLYITSGNFEGILMNVRRY